MSEVLVYIRGHSKKDPGPGNWMDDVETLRHVHETVTFSTAKAHGC